MDEGKIELEIIWKKDQSEELEKYVLTRI